MLYDGDKDGFRETVKRVWPQIRDLTLAAVEENGLIDKYREESGASYIADYKKRIRTYKKVSGVMICSPWSKTRTFKI